MKNILRLLLLLSLSTGVVLSGCSVRVYGVPKADWQRMTPAEQQQARAAYQERMRLYEERRLYEAKQRAHEAEMRAQKAREAELEAHKAREAASRTALQKHVHAPSLIHFTLMGGTIYVAGRHHPFQPVTVELRDGESKPLQLFTANERKPHHVQLVCSYKQGVLRLSNGNSRIHVQQFSFDNQWHHGRSYKNLTLGGGAGLRGGVMRVGSGANRDNGERLGKQQPMPAVSSGNHHEINNGKTPISTGKSRGIEKAIGASVSALAKGKTDNGHKEEVRIQGHGVANNRGQAHKPGQGNPSQAEETNKPSQGNQSQAETSNRGQAHKPGQGNQSQAEASNRGQAHKPNQGNQSQAEASNRGQAHKPGQGNQSQAEASNRDQTHQPGQDQSQAKNQKLHKNPGSNGKKNDTAQPQEELSSSGENPKDEENRGCGEVPANKNKRMECDNNPVVSKFTGKGRQD